MTYEVENSLSIVYWAIKSTRRATGVPVTWLETEDCISSLQGREAFTLVWYSHVCCIIVYNCTINCILLLFLLLLLLLLTKCSIFRFIRRWNSLQYCMIFSKRHTMPMLTTSMATTSMLTMSMKNFPSYCLMPDETLIVLKLGVAINLCQKAFAFTKDFLRILTILSLECYFLALEYVVRKKYKVSKTFDIFTFPFLADLLEPQTCLSIRK